MRACALAFALAALGCRSAPHIDLSLRMDNCGSIVVSGNPPAVTSCDAMTLDCASFVEIRLYESDANGSLGRILASNCLPPSQLGMPPNLCALQMAHAPFSLLDHLPDGKTVRFRMRALHDDDLTTGCNDDVPGRPPPTLVFDGFSPPVPLDGNDHRVIIELGVCGTCADLPRACGQGGPCGPQTPGCRPSPVHGGGQCCVTPPPPGCLQPGAPCGDGSPALIPPGGCCGVCSAT
jgi:hypothetical protein